VCSRDLATYPWLFVFILLWGELEDNSRRRGGVSNSRFVPRKSRFITKAFRMRFVFDYVVVKFISKHSGFPLPIIIPPLFHIIFSSRGWTVGPLEALVSRRQPRPMKSIETDTPIFFFLHKPMWTWGDRLLQVILRCSQYLKAIKSSAIIWKEADVG
jgi:hypothetical protein